MKRCYEELGGYVSTKGLDKTGVLIFGNIIGALERSGSREVFNAYKDLAETVAVGLFGNELITETEYVKLSELIDACSFDLGHSIKTHKVSMEEANRTLIGMTLYGLFPLYNEENRDEILGKSLIFRSNDYEAVSKFRTLVIYDDGEVFISEGH